MDFLYDVADHAVDQGLGLDAPGAGIWKRRPGISSAASLRNGSLRCHFSERVVEARMGMRSYRSA